LSFLQRFLLKVAQTEPLTIPPKTGGKVLVASTHQRKGKNEKEGKSVITCRLDLQTGR
jgi:hypothetical protein